LPVPSSGLFWSRLPVGSFLPPWFPSLEQAASNQIFSKSNDDQHLPDQ
jgi:hypothetical protein